MPKSRLGLEKVLGKVRLGSDSKKPPRPRHLFSFSGSSKQPEGSSMPRAANVSRDDILNSLTKHAHPQQGPVEEVSEIDEPAQVQDLNQTVVPVRTRPRGPARGPLIVFLGGFLAVWLYGYVTGAY